MMSQGAPAETVEGYIARFPPAVQATLRQIRETIRRVVPEGEEILSYRMPAVRFHGIVLYYSAFREHIGVYPPVHGSPSLERALARYRGEKGNLKFPLAEPFPYRLLERVAKTRARQNAAKLKVAAKAKRRPRQG